MELPPEAAHRVANDHVAWLTSVTDASAPAPNPVWIVPDSGDVLVFSAPGSRKVHNIEQRPQVSVHFNSDALGSDIVILNGDATLEHKSPPSAHPAFVAKYGDAVTDELGTTMDEIDATYDTCIRIRPTTVRLTPT